MNKEVSQSLKDDYGGPVDRELTEGTASSVTQETRYGRILVERAVRHELRIPLRYRVEGSEEWCAAESINMSESGILFSSNELLEVDDRLEITFQTSGAPLLQSSTRQALVVRRTLSNWPETRLVFGARFRA